MSHDPTPHEDPSAAPDTPGTSPWDGNLAAGLLSEIFAVDLTAALGVCAGCGRREALAGAALYGPDPGVVLRCRGCQAVLLRIVSAPGRAWLDLRGLAVVSVPLT